MFVRVLILFVCLAAFSSQVSAQSAGGMILGEIHDPQGAALANAHITIINTATGVQRELLTNDSGAYSAVNLQPGSYELTIQSPGFSVAKRKDINLTVGAEIVVDFNLTIGAVTESVEVTGQSSSVDLATSTIGRTVEGT